MGTASGLGEAAMAGQANALLVASAAGLARAPLVAAVLMTRPGWAHMEPPRLCSGELGMDELLLGLLRACLWEPWGNFLELLTLLLLEPFFRLGLLWWRNGKVATQT